MEDDPANRWSFSAFREVRAMLAPVIANLENFPSLRDSDEELCHDVDGFVEEFVKPRVDVNDARVVKELTEADADIKAEFCFNGTALHLASAEGNVEKVKELIMSGANVNSMDAYDATPLYKAAEKGNTDCVKALIKAGAKVGVASNRMWQTPLHLAVQLGNVEMVNALIKAGEDVNKQDFFKYTPLHFAAAKKNVEIVKALMKAGANAFIRNEISQTSVILVSGSDQTSAGTTFAKFPLSDFSCIQVMIKYSLLHYFRFSTSREYRKCFDAFPAFSKACCVELAAMSKDLVNNKLFLYNYLKETNANNKIECSTARSDCVSDAIFQRFLGVKYPIYSEVLCEYLGRSYFEEKFVKSNLFVQLHSHETGQRKITLNVYSMQVIAKYVPVYDLAKFVFAFTDSNV